MHTIDENEDRRYRKRYFGRGGVKIALLKLLAEEPMHGYQMIKALEEQSGGMYTPSAGSIYPTLQALADSSFISIQEEEGGKKIYKITEQGLTALSLLPERRHKRFDNHRSAEEYRFEKIRHKLSLSDQSYELLRLVTHAEQASGVSTEHTAALQQLLANQIEQLRGFIADLSKSEDSKGGHDL